MNIKEKLRAVLQHYEGQKSPDIQEFYNRMLRLEDELLRQKEETSYAQREEICRYAMEHYDSFHGYIQIYLDSMFACLLEEEKYTVRLLEHIDHSRILSRDNGVFLYYQLSLYAFRVPGIFGEQSRQLHRRLYQRLYREYKSLFAIESSVVPVEKRNRDIVVFLTCQFLNENHAPTQTILDRCYAMAKREGVQPVMINTAEMTNKKGGVPVFGAFGGNYNKSLSECDGIDYKGYRFPFHQCSASMPNPAEMQEVFQLVRQLNPYCIFLVGGSSFTADLCSNFYPLIVIGTVYSQIAVTEGQFQLTGKEITKQDREYVKKWGAGENHLQHCLFTFKVMQQRGTMTREQCGIPRDAFTALVVGARLDYEVSDEFIREVLLPVMADGVFVVFAGRFDSYPAVAERYPGLCQNSAFLGFVEDILALNEICDVYINPRRQGGGSSAVEAMIKGLPVLTLPVGDVALGVGETFHVTDYKAMAERLLALQRDREYYGRMSQKAFERAGVLTDTEASFLHAFHRIETLPEFK
jgi:glycosyltransferase involved in cell wall biosynthesis